jgi:hypothetical protein
MAFICLKQTSSVWFASLSSSFSPMQGIKLSPLARAKATFSPISYSKKKRAMAKIKQFQAVDSAVCFHHRLSFQKTKIR